MKYDKAFFDAGIERKHTRCVKWDAGFIGADDLPMWWRTGILPAPSLLYKPCASARSTPAMAITARIRATRPPFAATGSGTMA